MMIRTQIQLTKEQAEKAKRLATERGVSMAEVIRELIDHAPEQEDRAARFARALAAAGLGRDVEGKTDVSVNHDKYLADIYEEDLRKR
jgi:Arc/MetJ-type ribon-helix-helix transcriptional regulator